MRNAEWKQRFIYGITVVFFGMLYVGWKIWNMDFPIQDFSNTVFSMASKRNVDIQQAIRWYYLYVVLLCSLMAIFLRRISNITVLSKRVYGFIEEKLGHKNAVVLILAYGIIMGIRGVVKAHEGRIEYIYILLFYLFLLVIYEQLSKYWGKRQCIAIRESFYVTWLMAIVSLEMCFALMQMLLAAFVPYGIIHFVGYMAVLYILLKTQPKSEQDLQHIQYAMFPLLVAPVLSFFSLECIYLLRTYHFFITPYSLFLIYAVCCFWSYLRWRMQHIVRPIGEKIYLCSIVGAMLQAYVRSIGQNVRIDFFEGANHGLAIYDFIQGYGLPVLSNLDAHMLSSSFWGFLYALFNQDMVGALSAPYAYVNSIFVMLGIFFLVKQLLGIKIAYVMTMLFPVLELFFDNSYFIGIWLGFYFLYWIKHQNIFTNILLVLLCIFSFFYQADIAVSFGVMLELCAIFYLGPVEKKWCSLWVLLGEHFCVGIGVILGIYGVSFTANIDLLAAVNKFYIAMASNQNWAHGILAVDRSLVVFVYLLVPLLLAVLMLPIIQRIVRRTAVHLDWFLLFLYGTYIFNIPRTLVRHSMVEHSLLTGGLPLLLLLLLCVRRVKTSYRSAVFVCLGVVFALLMGKGDASNLVAHAAVNSERVMQGLATQADYAVHQNAAGERTIHELKIFFDQHLEPGETYLDFTSQSLLYAYLGRENPVYVNQSPAMVNGKKGQLEFLQEIKQHRVPFVLMPRGNLQELTAGYSCFYNVDGILNTDKYYLIVEYICNQYRPYCVVNDMVIWCLRSKYDEIVEKDRLQGTRRTLVQDYMYNDECFFDHDLGNIPFLWGREPIEADSYEKISLPLNEEKSLDEQVYVLPRHGIKGKSCFLALEIATEKDYMMQVVLDGENLTRKMVYKFAVKKGTHIYRLRCSSDLLWYQEGLDAVRIGAGMGAVKSVDLEIVK